MADPPSPSEWEQRRWSPRFQQQSFSSSRPSLNHVASMPIIAENGDFPRQLPPAPLRIPNKNPRRSMLHTVPPAYVPAAILPPSPSPLASRYDSRTEKQFDRQLEKQDSSGELDRGDMTPNFGEDAHDDKSWFAARKRSCRFIAVVVATLLVVIGLAVGLGVGLTKKKHSKGDSPDLSQTAFPAGSFAVDSSLQKTQTTCTSNPTTWRCYPYADGSSATFYWIIESQNSYTYTISSTDNPFAPSFANLSMTLLDGNQPSERLVFSFIMNKSVVPSNALTPTNRAAKCTFDDTTFEATLWTRRRGNETITPPAAHSKFSSWPGDIEIAQFKNSTLGDPHCEDSDGNAIADVQASGQGSCQCLYANFKLN